jgi:addiction module HigA family antidote
MATHVQIHPGSILREDCLRALNMSVTEAAKHLGVGRAAISALVNERASISIEMAHRLSKAFGSTPDHWMRMQLAYDLAQSRSLSKEIEVPRLR